MTSKIKVDNINKVSDDSNIIKKCGTTITVGAASDGVRTGADNLQAADGGNLISQSGTTITLGASGDTITLASGASQTGFGREGSVDWVTTPKTGTFSAVNGEGYFVNTDGGTSTANLPAGSAGAIVAFADYTRNFATNKLTITPNGSEKIGGVNASIDIEVNGQALTLVYVDGTEGWINIQNAEDTEAGTPPFIVACGGNATVECGNYRTHIFTAPGTFTVSNIAPTPSGNPNKMDYLVVAGGGSGGGNSAGGGGGAGGFRMSNEHSLPAPETSPFANPTGLTAAVQGYPITVGGGGTGASLASSPNPGTSGINSTFDTITSTGGGFGAGSNLGGTGTSAGCGGSGGGGSHEGPTSSGSGNLPPTSPIQGRDGGAPVNPTARGAGGGGIGDAGGTSPGPSTGGAGGIGSYISNSFVGPTAPTYGETGPVTPTRYFAGGGGGSADACGGAPGVGGGGAGGNEPANPAQQAKNGLNNTGGGGGGTRGNLPSSYTENAPNSTNGGSGIVMIRYKYQ